MDAGEIPTEGQLSQLYEEIGKDIKAVDANLFKKAEENEGDGTVMEDFSEAASIPDGFRPMDSKDGIFGVFGVLILLVF